MLGQAESSGGDGGGGGACVSGPQRKQTSQALSDGATPSKADVPKNKAKRCVSSPSLLDVSFCLLVEGGSGEGREGKRREGEGEEHKKSSAQKQQHTVRKSVRRRRLL